MVLTERATQSREMQVMQLSSVEFRRFEGPACSCQREERVRELLETSLSHVTTGFDDVLIVTGSGAKSILKHLAGIPANVLSQLRGHVVDIRASLFGTCPDQTIVDGLEIDTNLDHVVPKQDPVRGYYLQSVRDGRRPTSLNVDVANLTASHDAVSQGTKRLHSRDHIENICYAVEIIAGNPTTKTLTFSRFTVLVDTSSRTLKPLRLALQMKTARRRLTHLIGYIPLAMCATGFNVRSEAGVFNAGAYCTVVHTSCVKCSGSDTLEDDYSQLHAEANRADDALATHVVQRQFALREAVPAIRKECVRLRKMAAAVEASADSATLQLLLEQIADAEAAIGPFQHVIDETASRAAKTNDADDALTQAASNLKMSIEKQRAFAQAFKSAFLLGKEALSRKAQEEEFAKRLQESKDKNERLEIQCISLQGERDRLQYDGTRLTKELRRAKAIIEEMKSAQKRIEEASSKVGEELDAANTRLSLARFESTAEIHDLRAHSLSVERERDALELRVEALSNEGNQLRRIIEDHARQGKMEINQQVEQVQVELSAERAKRASLERHVSDLESESRELRQRIATAHDELHQSTTLRDDMSKKLSDERRLAKQKVQGILEAHENERRQYAVLLREGREILEEMGKFDAFRVGPNTADLSLYRGGDAAVRAWLEGHGMEKYASALLNAGFVDVLSLSQVLEADLVDMKMLTGHRRKLLALVDGLKADVAALRVHQQPKRGNSFQELSDQFDRWIADFEATLSIESLESLVPPSTA
jgi:hypothetical protein